MLTLDSFVSTAAMLFDGCTRDTASEKLTASEGSRLFKQLARRVGIETDPQLLSTVDQQMEQRGSLVGVCIISTGGCTGCVLIRLQDLSVDDLVEVIRAVWPLIRTQQPTSPSTPYLSDAPADNFTPISHPVQKSPPSPVPLSGRVVQRAAHSLFYSNDCSGTGKLSRDKV